MARYSRRRFLGHAAAGSALAASIGRWPGVSLADDAAPAPPPVPDHSLTVIEGSPRERGRTYGKAFREPIQAFLDREIYQTFLADPAGKDGLLRYAGACNQSVRDYSATLADELEGLAEGAELRLEEATLLSLHEELYHRGVIPPVEHCTAIAAGPPDTNDGRAYVGQNWDWMDSVYGLSSMLLWRRPEGPSVLAYSYPGLWAGAGLNSEGISLCWTYAGSQETGPRIGIPAYLLIAQMLYQPTLEAALEEARRAKNAGWFTFVLADGEGNLANVEASPKEMAIERSKGHIARVNYGSAQMLASAADQDAARHPQCQRMCDLLAGSKGRLNKATLQGFFGDHESTICKHNGTLDSMLFDCTRRIAYVSRGPGCSGRWRRFTFDDADWRPLFDGELLADWTVTEFGGHGEVAVADGAIRLPMGVDLTGITWNGGDLPKTNYEIELSAMRVDGNDFFCGLTFPVGDDPCSFIVGGWGGATVGLSSIDGFDASENDTTRYMEFKKGRWYPIRVRVTDERIQTWIDDEPVVDQSRQGHKIGIRIEVARSKPLGIASWCTTAAIRDIKLRQLKS